jgi:hypothetical protein
VEVGGDDVVQARAARLVSQWKIASPRGTPQVHR